MVVEEREVYTLLKAVSGFLSISLLKENLSATCRMEQEELIERIDMMLDLMPGLSDARSRLSTMQSSRQSVQSIPVSEPLYDDHVCSNQSSEHNERKECTNSSSYVAMGACITPSATSTMGGIKETGSEAKPDVYEIPDSADHVVPENVYQEGPDGDYDSCESHFKSQEKNEDKAKDPSVTKATEEDELAYELLKSRTKELNHFTPNQILEDCLLSGTLYKHKKKLFSNWNKRFCVVKEHFLFYFRSENDDKEKGVIILPGYNMKLFGPSKEKRFGFSLKPRNCKRDHYQFIVGAEEEVKKWMAILEPICAQKFSKEQSEMLRRLSAEKGKKKDEPCSSSDTSAGDPFPIGLDPNDEIYDAIEENSAGNNSKKTINVSASASLQAIECDAGGAKNGSNQELHDDDAFEEDDIYDVIPADQEESSFRQNEEPPSRTKKEISRTPSVKETGPALPPPRSSTMTQQNKDLDPSPIAMLPDSCPSPPLPARNPVQKSLSNATKSDISHSSVAASPPQLPSRAAKPDATDGDKEKSQSVAADLFSLENVYVSKEDCKNVADDELSFQKGDIIYIMEKLNVCWWMGCVNGRVGLVMNRYLIEAFPR